ncbi:MAG: response regulator transcription factor [Oscillospiraceae bacterium]|nr:response regulator transcription factor [Oscillospiraceae bacterium]
MIYCVEDDAGIRDMMVYALNAAGFEAHGFENGKMFFEEIKKRIPRLIMLDIMLPDEDGLTILKKIRENLSTSSVPVIMATAKGTEYDKVIGLDLGADDYLTKPFGMMEMISRVKAVLRRSEPKVSSKLLKIGNIELDTEKRNVTVEGADVQLTLKEYELLYLFMKNPDCVFKREQLLSEVWGTDFIGETRTIDVHIGTLRNKLGKYGEYIRTMRGVGYRLREEK